MIKLKVLFIACGLISVYSGFGYSAGAEVVAGERVTTDQADRLTKISGNYKADPSTVLSNQDIVALRTYAGNSTRGVYDSLGNAEKRALAQVINLHEDLFDTSLIGTFNNDQKLKSRMTTQDIRALADSIVDIRDGKALTPSQVSDVKDFLTMISQFPTAYIQDLPYLTQYASLNPDKFSSVDLDILRQASREAAGISADQYALLVKIANRPDQNLNLEDIKALQDLASKSSLGALNGLSPKDAILLHQTIDSNKGSFPALVISTFNRNYDRNQAIQVSAVPGSNRNRTAVLPQTRDSRALNQPKNAPSRQNGPNNSIRTPTSAGAR